MVKNFKNYYKNYVIINFQNLRFRIALELFQPLRKLLWIRLIPTDGETTFLI
jgi:hypothetical protein